MPKIKNWSRVPDSRADIAAWTHDKKNAKVSIVRPRKRGTYQVVLPGGNIKKYSTRDSAMEFARNWMEKHPRG